MNKKIAAIARTTAPIEEESNSPAAMKSLRSALRVLMEFTGGKPGYTVTELAALTGLNKSHISKIVAALADAELIRQDPDTLAYSVAARCFVLGSQFFNHDELSAKAMPLLRDLTRETGHSTRLSALDGERVAYLVGVNGPLFTDSTWKMGTYMPMHATASGRVLLAFMQERFAAQLIDEMPLPAVTRSTVTERATLRALVQQTRDKGYAIARDENTVGLSAVGAPVFDAQRNALGVITIAFPSHMVPREGEDTLLIPLHRAARMLSQRMGCPVYPFGAAA